jgi:hypothetical protein
MKTTQRMILMAVLSLIGFSLQSFAGNESNLYSKKKVKKQIASQISFPFNTIQQNEMQSAVVTFQLNEFNEIEIRTIECENDELKSFVEKEFNALKLDKRNIIRETDYKVELRFSSK